MATYLPRHGKKREQLAKHERALLALLERDADIAKVRKAAEVVRAAQVSVLRSKLSQILPLDKNEALVAKRQREIQSWLARPIDAVLDQYREKLNAERVG